MPVVAGVLVDHVDEDPAQRDGDAAPSEPAIVEGHRRRDGARVVALGAPDTEDVVAESTVSVESRTRSPLTTMARDATMPRQGRAGHRRS